MILRTANVTFHDDRCRMNRWKRRWLWTWAAIWLACGLAALLSPLASSSRLGLLIGPVLLLISFFLAEGPLSEIQLHSSGISIRNGLRKHRCRWSDVEGFRLGSSVLGQKQGFLALNDGRRIRCLVLSPTGVIGGGADLLSIVEALNERATILRHGAKN